MATETLTDRLQHIADAMGWSQTQMAEAIGASKQAVNSWLKDGHTTIDPKFAFAIADESGFAPRWILLGQGPERFPSKDELLGMSRNALAIAQLLDRLRS